MNQKEISRIAAGRNVQTSRMKRQKVWEGIKKVGGGVGQDILYTAKKWIGKKKVAPMTRKSYYVKRHGKYIKKFSKAPKIKKQRNLNPFGLGDMGSFDIGKLDIGI